MKRAKRSFSQKKVSISRRQALAPKPAWHWRLGSGLVVALLATILIPKPEAAFAATAAHKAPAKPELNVVVIGDLYSYGYATSSEAALRKSVPPTLQALNEVQAANKGVKLNVLFVPVTVATNGALFDPENQPELPALIRAVRDSSVVIVGVGGGNAALAGPMRSVLFDTAAPAKAFPQLMTRFYDGYYLSAQTALLDAVAALAAPGTSIVTLGYPAISPKQGASGVTWWSPFTGSTVSQQQANMSDLLVSVLNTANQQATSIVAATHSGLHFLDADLAGAMQGTGLSSSQQGPEGPAVTAIGNDLLPYISQAVDNDLVARNVNDAQGVLPSTSVPPWKLHVVLPIPTQTTLPRTGHASPHASQAETPPVQNNQANPAIPVYESPAFPGLLVSPLLPVVSSPPPPSASAPEGTAPAAQGTRNGNEQLGGHAGTNQPGRQPTAPSSPSPLPITLPVIPALPALPAPLPEPVTPAPYPDATDPGKDLAPTGGKGTSSTTASPDTGGVPVTGSAPDSGSAPGTGAGQFTAAGPVTGALPATGTAPGTRNVPAIATPPAPASGAATGAAPATGTAPPTGSATPTGNASASAAGPATGAAPATGTAQATAGGATTGTAPATGSAPVTGAAPATATGTAGTAAATTAGATTGTAPATGNAPAITTGAATGTAPATASAPATTTGAATGTAPATASAPATTTGAAPATTAGSGSGGSASVSGAAAQPSADGTASASGAVS